MKKIAINFCPTGMVPTKSITEFVPISATEIIEQVHEAYDLGITIAHLHARLENEQPTHLKSYNQVIFEGIKKHCPELIICASSSGRTVKSFEERSEVIELSPDMCSLTLSSLNFINQASVNAPDMIGRLAEKMDVYGVVPELECFDLGMINYGKYLIEKGFIGNFNYWNLIFGNIAGMQADLSTINAALNAVGENNNSYISFGGIGNQQFIANQLALLTGNGVRIGLEDNIWYDKERRKKAKNIELVRRIHDLMKLNELELFSSNEFRSTYFKNKM